VRQWERKKKRAVENMKNDIRIITISKIMFMISKSRNANAGY